MPAAPAPGRPARARQEPGAQAHHQRRRRRGHSRDLAAGSAAGPGRRGAGGGCHRAEQDTPAEAAGAQRRLRILQWVVPALTGAHIVMNAMLDEQERPRVVTEGVLRRGRSLLGRLEFRRWLARRWPRGHGGGRSFTDCLELSTGLLLGGCLLWPGYQPASRTREHPHADRSCRVGCQHWNPVQRRPGARPGPDPAAGRGRGQGVVGADGATADAGRRPGPAALGQRLGAARQ